MDSRGRVKREANSGHSRTRPSSRHSLLPSLHTCGLPVQPCCSHTLQRSLPLPYTCTVHHKYLLLSPSVPLLRGWNLAEVLTYCPCHTVYIQFPTFAGWSRVPHPVAASIVRAADSHYGQGRDTGYLGGKGEIYFEYFLLVFLLNMWHLHTQNKKELRVN